MSNRRPSQTDGPLFRPEEFREMRLDPTFTSGPAARHARSPIQSVHLGAIRDVASAARSGAATAGTAQPLSAPSAQRANRRSAEVSRRDRAWLAAVEVSQGDARQRLANLRKGRARQPDSLTGRLVAALRRADGWLTTRALVNALNDPAQTPPSASARTVSGTDVAASLAGYRKEGAVLARPVDEGSRLLEWRWAAYAALDDALDTDALDAIQARASA